MRITEQIALNYLNQHSEVYVEKLLLMEQTNTRWVFWSAEPIINRAEFYEVEIHIFTETISWKIVKGFGDLKAQMNYPIKPLHTLRQGDIFRFKNDQREWVCWLKVANRAEDCYYVRPITDKGELGEGGTMQNTLVKYVGRRDDHLRPGKK